MQRLKFLSLPLMAALLSLPFGMGVPTAYAAEDEESAVPERTRRVPTMSEQTYKRLSEVQEAMDAEEYDEAKELLRDMLDRSDRYNGNELGQIHNMFAYAYFAEENYEKAIEHYEQVVAQGEEIPAGLELGTLYSLAQLYLVIENYDKALESMRTWMSKAENPGPDPYHFFAVVYYEMQDYDSAIVQMEKAVEVARARDETVKENWWQLLRYLYYEKENWGRVLDILQILVRDFPKREYWIQLAGVYGQQGQFDKQVYAMEAAHVLGYLDREQDIVTYTGLLMQSEVPYRAAKWLSEGIEDEIVEDTSKNLRMLGQAYQLAQDVDEAIPVLEEAGEKSEDGDILARLAQLYLEQNSNEECIDAASSALDKGGLERAQTTYIVKGMCLVNAEQLRDARIAFVDARRRARREDDDSNERISSQWINYVDNAIKRNEQLEAALRGT